MSYRFYQCVYDLKGRRLNPTNVWTQINFWDDACWDRAVPRDCRGLTYIDIGCNEGLYLLRFEQSGGEAFGLDPTGLGFYHPIGNEILGKPYTNEGFLMLKKIYKARYKAQCGGFSNGFILPKQEKKFNIVSCMNTIEYVREFDRAVSELFSIAKDRVIICTETSLDKPTKYSKQYNARCVNLNELKSKIPWPCVYWILEVNREEEYSYEVFLVAENPESSLESIDTRLKTISLDITETQKNRNKSLE